MSIEVPIILTVLAILSYFLIKWILAKFFKKKKNLTINAVLGAILLAPILYIVGLFVFFSFLFYEPQYDFDQERWFANKQARFEMRDDLVDSKILEDKSRAEIIKLIGEPENKTLNNSWSYNLGMSGAGLG